MSDTQTMMNPLEFFGALFETAGAEEIQCIANLAAAQFYLEEIRDSAPVWAEVIARPVGAANADALRAILAAAEARGVMPQDEPIDEYAQLLAQGNYISWPPRSEVEA